MSTAKTALSVVGKVLLIFMALVVAAVIVIVFTSGKDSKNDAPKTEEATQEVVQESAPEEAPQEPAAQVFDTDFATLEYRSIMDSTGNAILGFMLTNKTDTTIAGYAENVLVNDQFSVQTLGGVSSISGIAAGKSGAVTLMFGVPTQTTLESVSEVNRVSGDFRIYPEDSVTTTIGYVHFDVTI